MTTLIYSRTSRSTNRAISCRTRGAWFCIRVWTSSATFIWHITLSRNWDFVYECRRVLKPCPYSYTKTQNACSATMFCDNCRTPDLFCDFYLWKVTSLRRRTRQHSYKIAQHVFCDCRSTNRTICCETLWAWSYILDAKLPAVVREYWIFLILNLVNCRF